jgi:hypothetical protein
MPEALAATVVVGVAVAVLCGVTRYRGWSPAADPGGGAQVQAALREVAGAVASLRPPVPRRESVTLAVMNGSLTTELLRVTVDARRRGPSVTVRTPDGKASVCVCSGRRADGVWEYRRVGVEREH